MSYQFKKVAVLCAQKKGVYSHSSGAVNQLSCAENQLSWRKNQSTGVKSQSIDAENHLSQVTNQIVTVELWDKGKDAIKFMGGMPAVAHPPCRLWGKLKGMTKLSTPEEKAERNLGRHCVRMVLENGGVVEHPAGSDLFADMALPAGGYANEKGFTLEFTQRIFGHSMLKPTWIFFAGIEYNQVLPIRPPLHFLPLKQIQHLSTAQREATPPELAKWLLYHAAIAEVAS